MIYSEQPLTVTLIVKLPKNTSDGRIKKLTDALVRQYKKFTDDVGNCKYPNRDRNRVIIYPIFLMDDSTEITNTDTYSEILRDTFMEIQCKEAYDSPGSFDDAKAISVFNATAIYHIDRIPVDFLQKKKKVATIFVNITKKAFDLLPKHVIPKNEYGHYDFSKFDTPRK